MLDIVMQVGADGTAWLTPVVAIVHKHVAHQLALLHLELNTPDGQDRLLFCLLLTVWA